jgi:predicted peroxiredoxin
MYAKYLLAFLILFFSISKTLIAQTPAAFSREERYAKLEPKMIYPLIKGSKMTGVIPIENISNKPAADQVVKLIFDFTQSTANNAQGTQVNEGLEEVARVMNLHIAAGYKKENLKTVIIFHSGSLLSILNDDYYQRKYSNSNPNNDLFNQFVKSGTELVVCGQSMQFRELEKKELLPAIQIAFSAKTTLTKYQSKGYQVFTIAEK